MKNNVIKFVLCIIVLASVLAGCMLLQGPVNDELDVNVDDNTTTLSEQQSEPTGDTTYSAEEETVYIHEHIFSETVVDAECESEGYTLCECECGHREFKNKIPALGHDCVTETIKPTYTAGGYDKHVCSRCGYEYTDNFSEKIPHDHKYSEKIVSPTCTKKGYVVHKCSLCGNTYKDKYVDAIGHKYEVKTIVATCVQKGYNLYTCSVCKYEYKDEETDFTAHIYEKITIEPTYTEKGYDIFTCSVCGKTYKDNYVDVIPHEHKYTEDITASTCTTRSYTTYTCSLCGHSYVGKETGSVLGHDYVAETVKPTAKEKGYDLYICSRCGDSYKNNYTDPVVAYQEVNETVYAISKVNIRKGPSTDYDKLGSLKKGDSITRIGIGDNNWSKVLYNDTVAYMRSDYLTTEKTIAASEKGYPKSYSDGTCTITIYKEWYENAYVYAAHITFSDYSRLWVECANGAYNSGKEKTSHAAQRVGAIFAINGDYATPGNGAGGYAIARKGIVCNDRKSYPEGVYNSATGILKFGHSGKMLSELVAAGEVTDTFQFGPAFLIGGKISGNPNSNSRAQRTFIGTNGNPGDIWCCVSDGRYNDGKSAGLNGYQCAAYLKSKGCTFGIPLDGGGSSTMVFKGNVLNAARDGQRSVADFLVFK